MSRHSKTSIYTHLYFHLGPDRATIDAQGIPHRVVLDDWSYTFFERYFDRAQLDEADDAFLDQGGETCLSGYQLYRLQVELQEALLDLSARPDEFKVLFGWRGRERTLETEVHYTLRRDELLEETRQLLDLLQEAIDQQQSVMALSSELYWVAAAPDPQD
ncbi:hypothetical protein [Leeia sp.]|uniref:hypothetical protein n=1 Tax=Leeia sp. TaxID=2884678 RepID=UPI0035B23002